MDDSEAKKLAMISLRQAVRFGLHFAAIFFVFGTLLNFLSNRNGWWLANLFDSHTIELFFFSWVLFAVLAFFFYANRNGFFPIRETSAGSPSNSKTLSEKYSDDPFRYKPVKDRQLSARNRWIYVISSLLGVIGFLVPFGLFGRNMNDVGWPAVGLAFGSAAVLSWGWVAVVTLPFGFSRYREFLVYYKERHGTGLIVTTVLCCAFVLFGLASVFELKRRGMW